MAKRFKFRLDKLLEIRKDKEEEPCVNLYQKILR